MMIHAEVVRGLNECIVRLEPDNGRRISASMQISDYSSAKADFGTELAISTRTELDPAAWLQQHGISCLELQHIAVRILSQTCYSFGFEHVWSLFDQLHGQRNNRLAQKRWNNLIYVHYNLLLRERQLKKRSNNSVSHDVLHEQFLDDWIAEEDRNSLLEEEETYSNEMEDIHSFENDMIDYGSGTMVSRKVSVDMLSFSAGNVEPSNPDATFEEVEEDDKDDDGGGEDDMNFLDDELSD